MIVRFYQAVCVYKYVSVLQAIYVFIEWMNRYIRKVVEDITHVEFTTEDDSCSQAVLNKGLHVVFSEVSNVRTPVFTARRKLNHTWNTFQNQNLQNKRFHMTKHS